MNFFLRRLDVDGIPRGLEAVSQARTLAQQALGVRAAGAEAHHDALRRAAKLIFLLAAPTVQPMSHFFQGQFAEPTQVALREKVLERRLDPLFWIDLAGFQ